MKCCLSKKHIGLAVCLLAIGFFSTAQDTTETSRNKQMRELLAMSKPEYKTYRKNIKDYDRSLRTVLKDSTLAEAARGTAIKAVLTQKRAYHQQALTAVQRRKLAEFNRQGAPPSLRVQQQKQVEDRLRSRGIRIIKDSTAQQP